MQIYGNQLVYIHESRPSLWLISTIYEVYEVYESSADAAWKAATLCLGTVPVVGYSKQNMSLIPTGQNSRTDTTKADDYNSHLHC